ncbi:MAG: polysaccharide deacetylase family protein [Phycisphaerae bacterium]|nr:polysaccharide deacetylase family protein [Phycisphaerae bacterium]
MLTVVMYHYVRETASTSRYGLKARRVHEFDAQLDYIAANFHVCSSADVVAAAMGKKPLPPRACLLTFDDGLIDHHRIVFPRLSARGWSAAFFPSAMAVERRQMLDVHKVHFILAVSDDLDALEGRILRVVAEFRREHDIPEDAELKKRYTAASRFDAPNVVFIKRLLQHGLPLPVRSEVADRLFCETVTKDECTFCDEVYLTIDQLRQMRDAGMEIGGHGERHVWLEHLSESDQCGELERTLSFLERVHGTRPANWMMCYPYGSYNATTLSLLKERGCAVGFTTRVGTNADLSRPLELARLDTNDLPACRVSPRWEQPAPHCADSR